MAQTMLYDSTKIQKMLKKKGRADEVVVWCDRVDKVGGSSDHHVTSSTPLSIKQRILLVTTQAIYNLSPSDYSCKRRIPLSKITNIIIAPTYQQMILQVPSEYDYKFVSPMMDEIATTLLHTLQRHQNRALELTFSKTILFEIDRKAAAAAKPGWGSSTSNLLLHAVARTASNASRSSLSRSFSNSTVSVSSFHSGNAVSMMDNKKYKDLQDDFADFEEEDEEEEKKMELMRKASKPVGLEDFEVISSLGQGAFGKVVKVRRRGTETEFYAMKILKKQFLIDNDHIEQTVLERRILSAFDCPFLLALKYAFQTSNKIYLLTRYYQGGELLHHLIKVRQFSEDAARFIIAELILAVGHLHSLNFVHRDLKPENILMDEEGHVCLSDFGLAKYIDPEDPKSQTFCGTPQYIAPEILAGVSHGKAVDWWSLGVLLYELVVGIVPFYAENENEIYDKIKDDPLKFPSNIPLTNAIVDLITKLLERDPSKRLGVGSLDFEEIMMHPFFETLDIAKLSKKEIVPVYQPKSTDSVGKGQGFQLTPDRELFADFN